MQDETVDRVIALCIWGGRISEQVLKQAVIKMLMEMERRESEMQAAAEEKKEQNKAAPCGKQSMKKLKKQGKELSSIEISDENIRVFEKFARKYGVGYCLKKDRSVHPPRYYVFFKAADVDAMTAAFREFTGWKENRLNRQSVKKKISMVREHAKRDRKLEELREMAQERSR